MKLPTHVVSVVVPTRALGVQVERCERALANQTRKPDEVIVTIDQEGRGPSWTRNEGLHRTHGDLIAFLDDDCLPPDNWLETLISAIDRHQADGVGGTYEETDRFLWEWRKRQNFPDAEQVDETGLVGIGGNLMIRRDWLERCQDDDGYVFNEAFVHSSEDHELLWRLKTRGAKLIYTPIKVTHLKKITWKVYLQRQFGRGIGISMLFRTQRASGLAIGMNKSRLWGQQRKRNVNWGMVLWHKVIGPFDRNSFSSIRYFVLFWLGEKIQSLGFLWGMLRQNHFSLQKQEQ